MRSYLVLTHVHLGFNPNNLFYFRLDPTMYADSEESERRTRQNALTKRLLDRLHALPGVISANESAQDKNLRGITNGPIRLFPDGLMRNGGKRVLKSVARDIFKR